MNLNCFKVQLFKKVKKVQNNKKLTKIAKWDKLPNLFRLKKPKVSRALSLFLALLLRFFQSHVSL